MIVENDRAMSRDLRALLGRMGHTVVATSDDFLAKVSHELRTPMNAILGMTELVLETPLDATQRESLRAVHSAAEGLFTVLSDLLDFTTIGVGKIELEASGFSLRSTVQEVLQTLELRAYSKGLECTYHIDAEVPDALIGDAARLRQVLVNLLGNAIKFTDRGEVLLEVGLVGTNDQGVALRFAVHDTGIGIAEKDRQAIFEAFEQHDQSSTKRYSGVGLGLTVSAHLVSLMGGSIRTESAPNRGSTFEFTARFGVERSLTLDSPTASISVAGMRVLVVDASAMHRQLLEQWLTDWKVRTTSVPTEVAAMDAWWHAATSAMPFELVLLDSNLPNTRSVALVKKIRDRAGLSRCHIALLISGDQDEYQEQLRGSRIDARLFKPVSQKELFRVLQRVARAIRR